MLLTQSFSFFFFFFDVLLHKTTGGTCTPGTQYLHDFPEKDTTKWKCENCPTGGNCSGSRTLKQVTGQRGYLRMSFDNQTFGKCLNYRACSNKNMNRTGLCLEGHHGELCSQCLTEWSKSSQTEPCTRCEDSGLTVVIFVGAILVAMAVFTFLVWDNLDGAREMIPSQDGTKSPTAMPFHSIAIRIVSSYLQVSGMLLRFDLTLPKSVQALIQVSLWGNGFCKCFAHAHGLTLCLFVVVSVFFVVFLGGIRGVKLRRTVAYV